jgi:aspartate/glutamate racemase
MTVVTADNVEPAECATVRNFFESRGLWFLASRNGGARARSRTAMSCRAAAAIRNRLGYTGIPIFDELKSFVGVRRDDGQLVGLHCRGHHELDMILVAAAVGAPVDRLGADELASRLGTGYGLVNPFHLNALGVAQYFDDDLTMKYFPPHTMMTNMGHHEWAVEFDPLDVLGQGALGPVVDISSGQPAPVEPVIGILTGNSAESGMLLWQRMIEEIRRGSGPHSQGDTAFPRVVVESLPEMGLSMELEEREPFVRRVVLEGVTRLCDAGATAVAIACNTTQYFSSEVRARCHARGVEFVSLVDAVGDELERRGAAHCDLLAVGPASDLEKFSDFRRLAHRIDLKVADQHGTERIEELAFDIKSLGVTPKTVQKFQSVVGSLAKSDVAIIALTELSLAAGQQKPGANRSGRAYVDTVSVLARALAERYLSQRARLEANAGDAGDDDDVAEDAGSGSNQDG